MIIRMFHTAVDPEDLERGKALFRDKVRPAFLAFEGCEVIEMHVGLEDHSGGLVDVVSVSKWTSKEAIDHAVAGETYEEAIAELKRLFQQNPIVRHFEDIE
jgi:quinol monooxygenase YgiN